MKNPERNREPADTSPEQLDSEDAERLLDEADDAVIDMEARERRRDSGYNTGGDDRDPGINDTLDANAPKELRLPPEKRGKS
jgi:hypothetical protein